MNPAFSLSVRLATLSLLLLVSACSSLDQVSTQATSPSPEQQELAMAENEESLQYTSAEQDETLLEELIGLDKTGIWGENIPLEQASKVEQVLYDFPITYNKQVDFYLDLFQNRQRKYFKKWLARSNRYVPQIREEFKAAGLPQDLAYLAMIESGFNPSAYSRAHAAGLWQFIRGTGKNYGLKIDTWVDERLEPEKATTAAIAYLSTLYKEFDNWYLAVAAYNAGEGKIGRAIKKYKSRDFWELARGKYLKLETKRYVPKLIAAIIIARDPEKYGFFDIPYQEPLPYERIHVPPGTALAAVAVTAETSVKKIRTLNNELKRNQTPPGKNEYLLKIPQGTKELVAANLDRLHPIITTAYKTHTVSKGDTLTRICKKYKLSKTTLLKANKLRSGKLKKGQRIRIPYRTTKYVLLKEGETARSRFAKAGKDGELILHEMRKGETLSKVSKQYNVPVELIMQWNEIANVRRVKAGQQLALYIGQTENDIVSLTTAQAPAQGRANVAILHDNKKRKIAGRAASDNSELTWYQVRNGDSLWTIAKKFHVSAKDIRLWNNLPSNKIHPGKKLVVKKG